MAGRSERGHALLRLAVSFWFDPLKVEHGKDQKERNNTFIGDVCAVECEDCQIDAGSIHVSALGLKGLLVKVEKGVVMVAKKSFMKRHKWTRRLT